MITRVVRHNGRAYVECLPGGQGLESENDALDLVAACGEAQTDYLMVHEECLPEAFFDLRTRLAGHVLLKFNNYRIRCAFFLPSGWPEVGRFYEMALEANRASREMHFFTKRESAEQWLLEEK